jgi:hypothetical protein
VSTQPKNISSHNCVFILVPMCRYKSLAVRRCFIHKCRGRRPMCSFVFFSVASVDYLFEQMLFEESKWCVASVKVLFLFLVAGPSLGCLPLLSLPMFSLPMLPFPYGAVPSLPFPSLPAPAFPSFPTAGSSLCCWTVAGVSCFNAGLYNASEAITKSWFDFRR